MDTNRLNSDRRTRTSTILGEAVFAYLQARGLLGDTSDGAEEDRGNAPNRVASGDTKGLTSEEREASIVDNPMPDRELPE